MAIRDALLLARIDRYLAALENDAARSGPYEHAAEFELLNTGAKYHRIASVSNGSRSVHAFVDELGNVYKPKGWGGPVKKPLYNLFDDDSYAAALRDASWSGRNLYAGAQSHKLQTD